MKDNKKNICFRLDPNLIKILRRNAANSNTKLVSIVEMALMMKLNQEITEGLDRTK